MLSGKRTPRRVECYLRYKKSSIFDVSPPKEDMSMSTVEITPKVNEKKCNISFQPKFDDTTAYQRYLKEYWNESNQLKDNKNYTMIDSSRTYNDIKEEREKEPVITNSVQRYIKDFYGDQYLNKEEEFRREKMKRSKSVYQRRTRFDDNEDDDFNPKKFKAVELQSNIFNNPSFIKQAPPEEKPIEEDNIYSESTTNTNSSNNDNNSNRIKAKLPTQFDWKYKNTELSTKEHINRSRNKEDIVSIHRKPPDFTYITSTNEVSQSYFRIPKKKPDSDINSLDYTITGSKNIFNVVEPQMIKKMFIKNGIHIYNFNDSLDQHEWLNTQRVTFKVRKEDQDIAFNKKINETKNELSAYGFKLDQVETVPKKFNKKRDATPGTALIRSKRPLKDKYRNIKPQYSVKYKNEGGAIKKQGK